MAAPTRVSIKANNPLEKEGFEVINEFMFIIPILLTSINFSGENILQRHESMGENKDVWISIHREKQSQKWCLMNLGYHEKGSHVAAQHVPGYGNFSGSGSL